VFCVLEQSLRFAVENFELVETNSSFVELSPSLLLELLSNDDIMVLKNGLCCSDSQQEQHVLETVLRYTAAREMDRRPLLPDMLTRAVRLNLIEPDALRETMANFNQFADEINYAVARGANHLPRSAGKFKFILLRCTCSRDVCSCVLEYIFNRQCFVLPNRCSVCCF
jgi:hypothetical protein